MATRSDVYARPDVYDMEYEGSGNHDAYFFARLLAPVHPRRVLELACGSGRVTFTLAAALRKAEIVGVDSSIDMLGKAATARDAAEPSVRERVSLVEGDMRDWPGTGDAFDAVIIPCCSVSHLTLDDRLRTWATAFRLLRPGGVLILDVRVPDLATLAEAQRVRPRAFVDLDIDATRRTTGEEARLLRCTATTYEPHLQRADVRLLYDRFDQRALAERLVTDFANHIYFPAELELLFFVGGLRHRAAVRRLPVRALRPHVDLCRNGGAAAGHVGQGVGENVETRRNLEPVQPDNSGFQRHVVILAAAIA